MVTGLAPDATAPVAVVTGPAPDATAPVAVVTGASQGLGAAVAVELARRGFRVALAARRPMGLVAVENRIRAAGGVSFVAPTDVTEPAQLTELFEETERRLGPLSALVNAAGAALRAPVVQTSEADFDRMVGVNLKGVFLATRAALRHLIPRRKGRIVNLSAAAGRIGAPRLAAYSAAKWGVLGFTRSCAEELRPAGISVFAACPGSVDTESYRTLIPGAKARSSPEEAARAIGWLASEAPAAMTGAILDLPG